MKEQVDELIQTHQDAAFELQAALGQLMYESEQRREPTQRQKKRAAFIEELKTILGHTPSQVRSHPPGGALSSAIQARHRPSHACTPRWY